jgi:DNA polymerase I-like protein with 3'-5' exonuclease and polymerase domains
MEEASQKALATRVSVTATGRKRFYLGMPEEVKREGINTPIQGTAGDIENESLIDLYEECEKHINWKLLIPVHDSNMIECPVADVAECARVMKAIMEKPRKLWGKVVVFPADISVSEISWGELEPYEDYIKNKGKALKQRTRSLHKPRERVKAS